jgi:CrcB protein
MPEGNGGSFFMLNYLSIMFGGALGTGARFWLSGFIAQRYGPVFPLGTLAVNVTGCFIIGIFAAFNEPDSGFLVSPGFRQFFMIGVCGGYTTFSSFGLQTLDLARDGDWLKAALNTVLSVVCCLVAVWLGRVLALTLTSR